MPSSPRPDSRRSLLTRLQRDEFLATGVLRVPGVIPRSAVEAMADRLWADMAHRRGVLRDRPETWTEERIFQFADLRRAGAFADMASPDLVTLLDDFFGGGWRPPARWGQPLVTFPRPGSAWSVPGAAWHLDVTPGQRLSPWPEYVRVFTFLAPLEPGGGGTAYVAGSYRVTLQVMAELGGRARSAAVREALKRESPWIAELCAPGDDAGRAARLMSTGAVVRGAPLRVAEMAGDPGDVVLMHPATLHAGSPNARRTPRLMLAESIYGTD